MSILDSALKQGLKLVTVGGLGRQQDRQSDLGKLGVKVPVVQGAEMRLGTRDVGRWQPQSRKALFRPLGRKPEFQGDRMNLDRKAAGLHLPDLGSDDEAGEKRAKPYEKGATRIGRCGTMARPFTRRGSTAPFVEKRHPSRRGSLHRQDLRG
ncbi:hypothetical protein D3C85_1243350 [compost metagenome]